MSIRRLRPPLPWRVLVGLSLALALALALIFASCSSGPPRPAALDAGHDVCASCRMPVSDPRLAAQLVAPGEEPRFFDDIGCLRDYLARNARPRGAACWVAEHRTGVWLDADHAIYVRSSLATPMGSHLAAFADAASAKADPAVAGGTLQTARDVFGSGPSGGKTP